MFPKVNEGSNKMEHQSELVHAFGQKIVKKENFTQIIFLLFDGISYIQNKFRFKTKIKNTLQNESLLL